MPPNALLTRMVDPAADRHTSFPRLLVVLAHPDDEILALGGRLDQLHGSHLLCTTNGAPANGVDAHAHGFPTLQAYADARRDELHAALRLAGLPCDTAHQLYLPQAEPELAADHTLPDQASVFYLVSLTRQIAREIADFRPEAVLTHPYEGGHPDHDSCAFAVHMAMQLLKRTTAPPILEAAFYHARHLRDPGQSGFQTGFFVPPETTSQPSAGHGVVAELTPDQSRRKRDLLACFRTQAETLTQFGNDRELFRYAPPYDFTQPPHTGQLLYEEFGWGVTGVRFRELAAAALESLRLPQQSSGFAPDA